MSRCVVIHLEESFENCGLCIFSRDCHLRISSCFEYYLILAAAVPIKQTGRLSSVTEHITARGNPELGVCLLSLHPGHLDSVGFCMLPLQSLGQGVQQRPEVADRVKGSGFAVTLGK